MVTCDTWKVTGDMWHLNHDTWCGVNIISKLELSCYNCLGVMMFWRFCRKRMPDWLNEWINYKGVLRSAPATPGLLKNSFYKNNLNNQWNVLKAAFCTLAMFLSRTQKILHIYIYIFFKYIFYKNYSNFFLDLEYIQYKIYIYIFLNCCAYWQTH